MYRDYHIYVKIKLNPLGGRGPFDTIARSMRAAKKLKVGLARMWMYIGRSAARQWEHRQVLGISSIRRDKGRS